MNTAQKLALAVSITAIPIIAFIIISSIISLSKPEVKQNAAFKPVKSESGRIEPITKTPSALKNPESVQTSPKTRNGQAESTKNESAKAGQEKDQIAPNSPEEARVLSAIKQLQDAVAAKNIKKTQQSIESLAAMGNKIIPLLVSSFNASNNPELQIFLVRTIAMIRDPTALKALLDLYPTYVSKQPNTKVQNAMILALSITGGRGVFDNFVEFLKTEKTSEIRKILSDNIIATGSAQKVDDLIKSNQGDTALVQELTQIKYKLEENESVQKDAAIIFHLDLSKSESIDKLNEYLTSDKHISLKFTALRYLGKSASPKAVKALLECVESSTNQQERDKDLPLNAISTLARLRTNDARDAIKKLLCNSDNWILKNTIEQTGVFGNKEHIPLLEQIILDDYTNPEIKTNAQKAIQTIQKRSEGSSQDKIAIPTASSYVIELFNSLRWDLNKVD